LLRRPGLSSLCIHQDEVQQVTRNYPPSLKGARRESYVEELPNVTSLCTTSILREAPASFGVFEELTHDPRPIFLDHQEGETP
jgi:hypothetical protein